MVRNPVTKLVALTAVLGGWTALSAQRPAAPACDPGNGGLTLPAGFCAQVIADDLGYARNLAVADNGDVYVSIRTGARDARPADAAGLPDGPARHRWRRQDGSEGALRHQRRHRPGAAQRLPLLRDAALGRAFQADPGQLAPAGAAEAIVGGFPAQRGHQDKDIAFDDQGNLYVTVGLPSNACADPDRQPGAKGQDPCPQLEQAGGVWKFSADTPGPDLLDQAPLRHRHAAGRGDRLARRPPVSGDEQPRLARHAVSGQVHARGEPEPSARTAPAGGRRRRVRLALLLPRRADQQDDPGAGVRRRRQGDRPLRAVPDAGGRLPRPLRPGRSAVLRPARRCRRSIAAGRSW